MSFCPACPCQTKRKGCTRGGEEKAPYPSRKGIGQVLRIQGLLVPTLCVGNARADAPRHGTTWSRDAERRRGVPTRSVGTRTERTPRDAAQSFLQVDPHETGPILDHELGALHVDLGEFLLGLGALALIPVRG